MDSTRTYKKPDLPQVIKSWLYSTACESQEYGPLTVDKIRLCLEEIETYWKTASGMPKGRFPFEKILQRFVRNVETFGSKGARFAMEIYLAEQEK